MVQVEADDFKCEVAYGELADCANYLLTLEATVHSCKQNFEICI